MIIVLSSRGQNRPIRQFIFQIVYLLATTLQRSRSVVTAIVKVKVKIRVKAKVWVKANDVLNTNFKRAVYRLHS
jgi:hypothetical protein